MKKGLIRESAWNVLSKAPTESIEVLYSRRPSMPLANEGCIGCGKCAGECPSKAITLSPEWTIDIGKCISCWECAPVCLENAISKVDAPDYALKREDLLFKKGDAVTIKAETVDAKKLRTMGRSIFIREVDAGSCNACEVEVNALENIFYDTERFGIKTVASPRHADVLLITGPLTENMYGALIGAVAATPDPKVIVAMGSCAISGGLFVEGDVVGRGISDSFKTDIFIPGCPPSPDRLIRSLLSAFGRGITAQR
jgi:Ni,Fe-hydrogenase III small subunit/NAD-dependent dihydropyrimidine dehydrogenase PreA subunit